MKYSAHERSRARRYAMQACYQWDLSGTGPAEIRKQFLEAEDFSRTDRAYFNELLREIPKRIENINKNISENIDRPLEQLDPVERAILRIAVYELLLRAEIPYRVIINEAVNLAKKFGAEQGHTFVNAVLDQVARSVRPVECAGSRENATGR